MSHSGSKIETEIKLRLPDAAVGRKSLGKAGFQVSVPRILEQNTLYDTGDFSLRERGVVLRLRQTGEKTILTLKGPSPSAKYKAREESEVSVSDFRASEAIFTQLGYQPVFRYEKYRTEFASTIHSGTAYLDETPIGVFLELEGTPAWIDETAQDLGFQESDYVIESYGMLYLQYREEHTLAAPHMIFSE